MAVAKALLSAEDSVKLPKLKNDHRTAVYCWQVVYVWFCLPNFFIVLFYRFANCWNKKYELYDRLNTPSCVGRRTHDKQHRIQATTHTTHTPVPSAYK